MCTQEQAISSTRWTWSANLQGGFASAGHEANCRYDNGQQDDCENNGPCNFVLLGL